VVAEIYTLPLLTEKRRRAFHEGENALGWPYCLAAADGPSVTARLLGSDGTVSDTDMSLDAIADTEIPFE